MLLIYLQPLPDFSIVFFFFFGISKPGFESRGTVEREMINYIMWLSEMRALTQGYQSPQTVSLCSEWRRGPH